MLVFGVICLGGKVTGNAAGDTGEEATLLLLRSMVAVDDLEAQGCGFADASLGSSDPLHVFCRSSLYCKSSNIRTGFQYEGLGGDGYAWVACFNSVTKNPSTGGNPVSVANDLESQGCAGLASSGEGDPIHFMCRASEYCKDEGYVTGFQVDQVGDSANVYCLSSDDVVEKHVLFDADLDSQDCGFKDLIFGRNCMASRYCQSEGYDAGFQPYQNGNDATVYCFKNSEQICTDTDLGLNVYEKGVTVSDPGAWCQRADCTTPTTETDFCVNTTTVKEYACWQDGWYASTKGCTFGCYDGACVTPGFQCVDTDIGENLAVSGKVAGFSGWDDTYFNIWSDWCSAREGLGLPADEVDATEVTQYSCTSPGTPIVSNCENGFVCSQGKCIDSSLTSCAVEVVGEETSFSGTDSFDIGISFTGEFEKILFQVGSSGAPTGFIDSWLCRDLDVTITDAEEQAGRTTRTCSWTDAPTRDTNVIQAWVMKADGSYVACDIEEGMDLFSVEGSYTKEFLGNGTVKQYITMGSDEILIINNDYVPSLVPEGRLGADSDYKVLFTNIGLPVGVYRANEIELNITGGNIGQVGEDDDFAVIPAITEADKKPIADDPFELYKIVEGGVLPPGPGEGGRCGPLRAGSSNGLFAGARGEDAAGVPKYCDPFTLTYINQSVVGDDCENDYECLSNVCVEGKCYSLRTEVERQGGLIQRILCIVAAVLPGGDTYLTCMAEAEGCIDTDVSSEYEGGANPFEVGTTVDSTGLSRTDYCEGTVEGKIGQVRDFVCSSSNTVVQSYIDCSTLGNYVCDHGKCIPGAIATTDPVTVVDPTLA